MFGPAGTCLKAMRLVPSTGGYVEVCCGPMMSGKSSELIRRVRLAQIAGKRVVVCRPRIDDRYAADAVATKTPVSGLGDDALYVETSGAALYVKKGDFVFQIRIHGFPLEEIKAKEKTLAVDVMAKL